MSFSVTGAVAGVAGGCWGAFDNSTVDVGLIGFLLDGTRELPPPPPRRSRSRCGFADCCGPLLELVLLT